MFQQDLYGHSVPLLQSGYQALELHDLYNNSMENPDE